MIGGQAYRILPISTEEWDEKKDLFDEKTGMDLAKRRVESESQGREGTRRETILGVFRGG